MGKPPKAPQGSSGHSQAHSWPSAHPAHLRVGPATGGLAVPAAQAPLGALVLGVALLLAAADQAFAGGALGQLEQALSLVAALLTREMSEGPTGKGSEPLDASPCPPRGAAPLGQTHHRRAGRARVARGGVREAVWAHRPALGRSRALRDSACSPGTGSPRAVAGFSLALTYLKGRLTDGPTCWFTPQAPSMCRASRATARSPLKPLLQAAQAKARSRRDVASSVPTQPAGTTATRVDRFSLI